MHAADKLDRLDLGERLLVAGVYIPLGLGLILSIAGAGLGVNAAALGYGIVSALVLVLLGNWLFQGSRLAHVLALAWTGMSLLLGMALLALVLGSPKQLKAYDLPGVAGTWVLTIACLSQLIFGLFVFLPKSVHEFLAAKRGEEVGAGAEEPAAELFALSDNKATLRAESRTELSSLAKLLQMASFALLGLAGLCILGGILMLSFAGSGWSLFAIALLAFALGNILRTPGEDMQFLAETTGVETAHLTNTVNGLGFFCKLLATVSAVLALVLLIKLVF